MTLEAIKRFPEEKCLGLKYKGRSWIWVHYDMFIRMQDFKREKKRQYREVLKTFIIQT